MKVGDPKTARLLIFVAIGAIGFVVIQVLPSNGGGNRAAATATESSEPDQGVAGLSEAVAADSFSSPLLARTAAKTEEQPEASNVRPLNPGITGALPIPMNTSFGGSDPIKLEPTGSKETGPPAPEKPKRTVLLSGIVSVDSPVAFIALDGKESRGCRVGERLASGIKLLSIDDNTAVLSVGGRRKVLSLGQVTEL
jgi:hypothetical protein